jgi:O-antigen ligase
MINRSGFANPDTKNNSERLVFWVHACLFFGAAATLMPSAFFTVGPLVLSIIGLYLLLSGSPDHLSTSQKRPLLYLALACWAFAIGGSLINIINGTHWHIVAPHLPFLFYPLILWVFIKTPHVDGRWLIRGAALGGLIAFCYVAWMHFAHQVPRPTLHRSPISFGNTGILLSAICFLGLYISQTTLERIYLVAGGLAGLGVSVLSGSRGGWLSIVILIIFSWQLLGRTKFRNWRHMILVVSLATIAFGVLYPKSIPHQRLGLAVTQTIDFIQHGDENTPVGARLAMWEFAAKIASEKPILGFGFQGTRERWQHAIDSGEYSSLERAGSHFHNELLQFYFNIGAVGLVLVLLIYLMSISAFYRHRWLSANQYNIYAACGLAVVLMYFVFGLTNGIWSNNSNRQIFMFLVMGLAGLTVSQAAAHRPSSIHAAGKPVV